MGFVLSSSHYHQLIFVPHLARVNSMYRVRNSEITQIVKGDPQQTHQSYLLSSRIEVIDGDYLVGQCVYDNNDDRVVKVG